MMMMTMKMIVVHRHCDVELVQWRPANVVVERWQVSVLVALDGRHVAWHMQTTGDEPVVTVTRRVHGDLTCGRMVSSSDVVTIRSSVLSPRVASTTCCTASY